MRNFNRNDGKSNNIDLDSTIDTQIDQIEQVEQSNERSPLRRKAAAIAGAIVLSASLVACGSNPEVGATDQETPTAESSETTDEEPDESEIVDEQPVEEDATTTEGPDDLGGSKEFDKDSLTTIDNEEFGVTFDLPDDLTVVNTAGSYTMYYNEDGTIFASITDDPEMIEFAENLKAGHEANNDYSDGTYEVDEFGDLKEKVHEGSDGRTSYDTYFRSADRSYVVEIGISAPSEYAKAMRDNLNVQFR